MFISKRALQATTFSIVALLAIAYGIFLILNDKDEEQIGRLKEDAKKGDIQALNKLGVFYADGRGVKQDEKVALSYFQKATVLDNPHASFNIALFYQYGRGELQQDIPTAVSYYERAAQNGNVAAMHNLATLYFLGRGVEKDNQKAFSYYEKAANLNYAPSMHNLAILYLRGLGVWKNAEMAKKWMERAAASGDAKAQDLLSSFDSLKN